MLGVSYPGLRRSSLPGLIDIRHLQCDSSLFLFTDFVLILPTFYLRRVCRFRFSKHLWLRLFIIMLFYPGVAFSSLTSPGLQIFHHDVVIVLIIFFYSLCYFIALSSRLPLSFPLASLNVVLIFSLSPPRPISA